MSTRDGGKVIVRIVADASQFTATADKASGQAAKLQGGMTGAGGASKVLGRNLNTLGGQVGKTGLHFSNLTNTVTNASWQMQRAGIALSIGITAPLLGAAAAAVKVSTAFEHSSARITGLVGVQKSVMAGWRSDMEATSRATGVGIDQLAESMYFVTTSGFRGAEALGILNDAARASAAGLGEAKDAAWLTTAAINAYGSANINSSEILDTLAEAVRLGRFEVGEMSATMGRLLPICL